MRKLILLSIMLISFDFLADEAGKNVRGYYRPDWNYILRGCQTADGERCNIELYTAMVKAAREANAVDTRGDQGQTALHYRAVNGDIEEVDALLEHGNANPRAKDSLGRTPLHHVMIAAISKGFDNEALYKVAKKLIDAGAFISDRDFEDSLPISGGSYINEENLNQPLVRLLNKPTGFWEWFKWKFYHSYTDWFEIEDHFDLS